MIIITTKPTRCSLWTYESKRGKCPEDPSKIGDTNRRHGLEERRKMKKIRWSFVSRRNNTWPGKFSVDFVGFGLNWALKIGPDCSL